MRRKMLSVAILAMLALGCSAKASAQDISIDETNFPDPGLREYVQTVYDTNKDGVLSDEENAAAKEMNVYFNTDPDRIISARISGENVGYDMGNDIWPDEFPCSRISEHPLEGDGKRATYDYYAVSRYRWKCVINRKMTNWKGIELLTHLKSIYVGGKVSRKLTFSNMDTLVFFEIGGDDSAVESITIKNCPKLRYFTFTRTNHLKKVDLSKGNPELRYVLQYEYSDSISREPQKARINLQSFVIGKAPKLKYILMSKAPVKHFMIDYRSLRCLNEIWLYSGNKEQEIDLSRSKKLNHVTINGKCGRLVLPDRGLTGACEYDRYGDDYYKEMIPFGPKDGPKILDLSKSTRADDYADQYIFPELMRKLKKGKVRTRTLIVSRKMYDNRWNTLRLLRKKGIKIQIKG